jgi:hypothetical protein
LHEPAREIEEQGQEIAIAVAELAQFHGLGLAVGHHEIDHQARRVAVEVDALHTRDRRL